jgi:hypothetical protein
MNKIIIIIVSHLFSLNIFAVNLTNIQTKAIELSYNDAFLAPEIDLKSVAKNLKRDIEIIKDVHEGNGKKCQTTNLKSICEKYAQDFNRDILDKEEKKVEVIIRDLENKIIGLKEESQAEEYERMASQLLSLYPYKQLRTFHQKNNPKRTIRRLIKYRNTFQEKMHLLLHYAGEKDVTKKQLLEAIKTTHHEIHSIINQL